jgi:hypothetical protein
MSLNRPPLRPILACILIALLAQTVGAQGPAAPLTALPAVSLRVLILEGANAVNSIPNRSATFPVVEVRDENDLPVEGADVVFELPATGPGGTFPNQKHTFSGRTNVQGQVRAPFLMNAEAGPFEIKVMATIGSRKGKAVIAQTHSMQTPEEMSIKKKRWYKDWRVWAIAGGAATAGIILGTRGGGSSGGTTPTTPVPPTITITPGGPSIGGPR